MKGIEKPISAFYILLACIFFGIDHGYTQSWEEQHENLNARDIEVLINAGMTSYYGDLSIYDNNFIDKLNHESGIAMSVVLTKRLTPQIGISGQLLTGRLKARLDNVAFESTLFEYNMHVRLNMVRLFTRYYKSKISWDVFFGFGNFLFKSTKTTYLEGDDLIEKHSARVPELVFFGGTGLSYRVNEKISMSAELSLHQFQNDKIDISVNNSDFDYFTYFNFGITYYIRSYQKTAPRNKARIAHSTERRKPLKD